MTMISFTLEDLANIALLQDDAGLAVQLAGTAEEIRQTLGGGAPPALIKRQDFREPARPHLPQERIDAAWEKGRRMSIEEALEAGLPSSASDVSGSGPDG